MSNRTSARKHPGAPTLQSEQPGGLPVECSRDAKILDLFEGTQQIQLLVIARQLLGLSSAQLR
jgi:hypothetical protein